LIAGPGITSASGPTVAGSAAAVTGASGATESAAPAGRAPDGLRVMVRDLHHAVRLSGTDSGGEVYDVTTKRTLFSLRGSVARPPASIEKLFTSVALLTMLGPETRLRTTVLGRGSWRAGGTWEGDLYLKGGGDPTLGTRAFNDRFEHGEGASIGDLVRQLTVGHGLRRVTGQLFGDGSLFDDRPGGPASDYAPDLVDLGGELDGLTIDHGASGTLSPAAHAAGALVRALNVAHVRVRAGVDAAVTPAGSTQLASVQSPPLTALLGLMNRPSDDFFAEMLTEQLGARFEGRGSIAAGVKVIARVLGTYGLHPRLLDGSGLSHDDSTTPQAVVRLLTAVAPTGLGRDLFGSLAVAGSSGTLADRMRHTPARGHCWAKTGTLDYVSNLAGYCRSAGGDLLAFSFFMDDLELTQAHTLQDSMAITLARDDPDLP
jgi:D-alanyl-D-alanine carboxypeptidase/D-alanyl-D-alanine-endopeptidase (penicillin-binding protein 4)